MLEMKDSGVEWIGAIPSRWSTVQLGSIFSEHKHKNTGMQSNNLLSLSYGNIVRKDINTLDGLLPESFEGYNVIGPGDIVLRLTDLQNDQRSLRVGICREKGIVTSAYVTLRRRTPSMNSQFFYYLIHSYDVRKGFYGMGAGVRQGLNYAGIKKIALPLPSAGEQSRIVLLLNEKHAQIDALIQNVQTQIEKLKAYKQSLITEVVTKGLDPTVPMKDSGVEWLGDIPEKWQMRKANTLSERIVVGVVIRPSEYFDIKGTIPFLRGLNVKDYQISTENLVYITEQSNQFLSKSIVNEGDILIVRDGNIGASCIVPPELAGANVVSMIIFTANSECTSPYICYCLNSLVGKHQFELSKIGSALTHTSVSAVSRLVFPLPAVEEQNCITAYLEKKCAQIDRLVAIKQAKIEKLEQYKRSLIYEYVTGKKEVRL